MNIRTAKLDDLAAVTIIFNHYLEKGSMRSMPKTAKDFAPFALENTEDGRYAMIVGELDGRIIGYAGIQPYSELNGYRHAGLSSVYLLPELTGNGYGKILMRAVLQLAPENEYRYLEARIWTDNLASIRLHEYLGYERVGVQKGIGVFSGENIDVLLLGFRVS